MVGADYIIMVLIMEEVPGVHLGHRWTEFESPSDVMPIMTGILDVETKFESLGFSRIGSLYFTEDVGPDLQAVPLLSGAGDSATRLQSARYRGGPFINYQRWRGERLQMARDRGPCKLFPFTVLSQIFFLVLHHSRASSYFMAAAKNEQIVLEQSSPDLSRFRRKPTHDHATHSKLLSMFMKAIPHFMPPSNSDICAPTLWRPDLSLGNLFVSATGPAHLQVLSTGSMQLSYHISVLRLCSLLSYKRAIKSTCIDRFPNLCPRT
jgi:hypothetical protein